MGYMPKAMALRCECACGSSAVARFPLHITPMALRLLSSVCIGSSRLQEAVGDDSLYLFGPVQVCSSLPATTRKRVGVTHTLLLTNVLMHAIDVHRHSGTTASLVVTMQRCLALLRSSSFPKPAPRPRHPRASTRRTTRTSLASCPATKYYVLCVCVPALRQMYCLLTSQLHNVCLCLATPGCSRAGVRHGAPSRPAARGKHHRPRHYQGN